MTAERATPGAGFWAAVVLMAVPNLYFVSIGPVARGASRLDTPRRKSVEQMVRVYFIPANMAFGVAPEPVQSAVLKYVRLFRVRRPRR